MQRRDFLTIRNRPLCLARRCRSNEIAIKAFKEGKIPFPDGTIIAALHWDRVKSEDNSKLLVGAFPGAQSFVVGSAVNAQFMVKDSKKYAATGGWGSATLRTENLATKHCTEPASPAMSLQKIATTSSHVTHLRPELKFSARRFCPGSSSRKDHRTAKLRVCFHALQLTKLIERANRNQFEAHEVGLSQR